MVFGGRVEATITFNWTKYAVLSRNGTGMAFGRSDNISFGKFITIENGSSYSFDLLDYENVTWGEDGGEPFRLNRIEPADSSDDDKAALTKMVNNLFNASSIRILLEQEIDKIYSYFLRASLHD